MCFSQLLNFQAVDTSWPTFTRGGLPCYPSFWTRSAILVTPLYTVLIPQNIQSTFMVLYSFSVIRIPPPVTGLLLCIFICRQCDIGSHTQPLSNKFLEGFSGLLELSSTRNCLVKINIITLSDARRWSRLNRPLCLSVLIFQPFVIIILWR